MNRSEGELLERAQHGDMDAFAALFEPMRPRVFGVARALVGASDAEDVVMDTFLKAWQALPGLRRRASLVTWVYRITRNCALDHIRKRQRRHEVSLSSGDDGDAARDVPDDAQPLAHARLEAEEIRETLSDAMARLPDTHRVALELRYREGLSYAELAAAQGISIGTVMSRLFNAKRKMRAILVGEA